MAKRLYGKKYVDGIDGIELTDVTIDEAGRVECSYIDKEEGENPEKVILMQTPEGRTLEQIEIPETGAVKRYRVDGFTVYGEDYKKVWDETADFKIDIEKYVTTDLFEKQIGEMESVEDWVFEKMKDKEKRLSALEDTKEHGKLLNEWKKEQKELVEETDNTYIRNLRTSMEFTKDMKIMIPIYKELSWSDKWAARKEMTPKQLKYIRNLDLVCEEADKTEIKLEEEIKKFEDDKAEELGKLAKGIVSLSIDIRSDVDAWKYDYHGIQGRIKGSNEPVVAGQAERLVEMMDELE